MTYPAAWRRRVVAERRKLYYAHRHHPEASQQDIERWDRKLAAAWRNPPDSLTEDSIERAIAEIFES